MVCHEKAEFSDFAPIMVRKDISRGEFFSGKLFSGNRLKAGYLVFLVNRVAAPDDAPLRVYVLPHVTLAVSYGWRSRVSLFGFPTYDSFEWPPMTPLLRLFTEQEHLTSHINVSRPASGTMADVTC